MSASSRVLEAIRALLADSGVEWQEIDHEPVRTSEEAAEVRGCPLRMGAKSIVFKAGDRFGLFVLSAAAELESKRIRKYLHVQRTRFATPAELLELTGLEPGSVPPFGGPILSLPLYADPSLLVNDRIAFTAGRRDVSVVMDRRDYIRVAKPEMFAFSR